MIPTSGRTRIAPTPSGFIHIGNVLNFLLTKLVAQELNLALDLRIDDIDNARTRPAYVEDIFRVLDWLEIEPSGGPKRPDHLKDFTQLGQETYLWQQLEQIVEAGADVFICLCSRPMRKLGRCVSGCSGSITNFESRNGAIRCRAGDTEQTLWQLHPTYHLVNVVFDRDLGTTHVVRGEDLAESSAFHSALNQLLSNNREIKYAHHPLLLNSEGRKLSKSQGTSELVLTSELRMFLDQIANDLLPGVLRQF